MGGRRWQRMALDPRPGHRETSDEQSSGEKRDEDHLSTLMRGSRDHERNGELPEET